jgi:hypothetical protein
MLLVLLLLLLLLLVIALTLVLVLLLRSDDCTSVVAEHLCITSRKRKLLNLLFRRIKSQIFKVQFLSMNSKNAK